MTRHRRRPHAVWVAAATAACALGIAVALRAADPARRTVWALQAPTATTLDAVGGDRRWTVRWAERGLVVFEGAVGAAPPPAWQARALLERPADWDLAIARGPEFAPPAVRDAGDAVRGTQLAAAAGPVWIGVAPGGRIGLDACHGEAFRAPQVFDLRALVDAGPPAAVAPAVAAAATRPLPPSLRRIADAVATDSLAAWLGGLARTPGGDPADRYVRNADLGNVYIPLVQRTMQRFVAAIPGATVALHPVFLDSSLTTYNVVARIPAASQPASGTFVVSAHVDATGSQDPLWIEDIVARRPVVTPGAEDNGSGVAAVLEALRCIADGVRSDSLDFAVDLEFIAFSAEEIGLVGSDRYVRAPRASPFIGCINLDMVGYNDSLPGNLTLAHNPQSRWLAQFVADAAADVAPPRVTPALDLDESRASDHNSFWTVGAAGILLADAPITTLRRYDTYHRPNDRLERVDLDKLTQVTRAAVAALVRFDTDYAAEPLLSFEPTDLQLRFRVNQQLFRYVPGFHLLVPGAPLFALATVHSLGAPFTGTLRVELSTERLGRGLAFFDSTYALTIPTAGQFVVQRQVPILAATGWHRLHTRVTSQATGGMPVTASAQDSFLVEPTLGRGLALVVRPNPIREWNGVTLEFAAIGSPGGRADVEIYDLEGQRVAEFRRLSPQLNPSGYSLALPHSAAAGTALDLQSGAYIVRLLWRDSGGTTNTATAPLAVVR